MRDLHSVEFDHYLKATEHTPEMIAIIEKLIEHGNAYVVDGTRLFQRRQRS